MDFRINGNKWIIEEISNGEMITKTGDIEGFTHGLTEYAECKVYINEGTPEKKRTLYHELMHVWMYEYGHNQFSGRAWNNEDICEMVAASHNFIHSIAEAYFEPRVEVGVNLNGKEILEGVQNLT